MAQQTPSISKMETVQTAVEWLMDNIPTRFKNALLDMCKDEIEQAKHKEMMQIVQAYHRGLFGNMELEKSTVFGDQYYKQTYNK
jgi:hypothetical protein